MNGHCADCHRPLSEGRTSEHHGPVVSVRGDVTALRVVCADGQERTVEYLTSVVVCADCEVPY